MKNIGIIGAMKVEIEAITAAMEIIETKQALGKEYHIGRLA